MSEAKLELLTPANNTLVLIDYQPQMLFGVASIDRQLLKNNAVALAEELNRAAPDTPIFILGA
jgi:hypothetical protein